MSDEVPDPGDEDQEDAVAAWDALTVLQGRAEASRAERDAAIESLRESMSDDEIREDFCIDLGDIER